MEFIDNINEINNDIITYYNNTNIRNDGLKKRTLRKKYNNK